MSIEKTITQTHLFIHHILRFHLSKREMTEAVRFATYYASLVYFAHSLEVLLHAVLEDEADSNPVDIVSTQLINTPPLPLLPTSTPNTTTRDEEPIKGVLPLVVEFLDHFPEALQVVVGCARKTDVKEWGYLFKVVGRPRHLFEKSLQKGLLKIAASYLLVLHNLDPLEQSSRDTIRLYKVAVAAKDWVVRLSKIFLLSEREGGGVYLFCCY